MLLPSKGFCFLCYRRKRIRPRHIAKKGQCNDLYMLGPGRSTNRWCVPVWCVMHVFLLCVYLVCGVCVHISILIYVNYLVLWAIPSYNCVHFMILKFCFWRIHCSHQFLTSQIGTVGPSTVGDYFAGGMQ